MLAPFALVLVTLPAAPAATVGKVTFPISCKPAAQRAFERGVSALHSFWYEEALRQFRAAQKSDGKCQMASWGEAFAHIQLLWLDDDTAAARAALSKMPGEPPTARERDWVAAIRPLVAAGDLWPRRAAFAAEMERLFRAYPDDDEVKAFLSIGLIVKQAVPDLATQARAAALAMEVAAHNPDHPGAAHYTIHALDTSELAPMALPAAKRYARIAPEAYHARHMPAHIFTRLGRWTDALASCESAWAASQKWVDREKLGPEKRDLHSLSWIVAINLELGKPRAAEAALQPYAELARAGKERGGYVWVATQLMRALGDFSRLDALLAPALSEAPSQPPQAPPPCHGSARPVREWLEIGLLTAKIEAAAARHDVKAVDALIAERNAARKKTAQADAEIYSAELWPVHQKREALTDQALRAEAARDHVTAAARWHAVALLDDRFTPPEGADGQGGAWLRAGQALLAAGKPAEAIAELTESLKRFPAHGRTLVALGQATAATGDLAAARAWMLRAAEVWAHAEPDYAPAREVQAWLAAHPATAQRP